MKIFDLIQFRILFILICVFGQISAADKPKITCNDERAGHVETTDFIDKKEEKTGHGPGYKQEFLVAMRKFSIYRENNSPNNRFCPIPLSFTFNKEEERKKIVEKMNILDDASYNLGDYADIALPFDSTTKEQWNFRDGEKIGNCERNSDCFSLNDDKHQGYCEFAAQPSVKFYFAGIFFPVHKNQYREQKEHRFCYKIRRIESSTFIVVPYNVGLVSCKDIESCDGNYLNPYLLWDCVEAPGIGSAKFCAMKYQTTNLFPKAPIPTVKDDDIDKVLLPYSTTSNSMISKDGIIPIEEQCTSNAQCGHLTKGNVIGYCMASRHNWNHANHRNQYGKNATFCYAMIPEKLETYLMDRMKQGPRTCKLVKECPTGYACRKVEIRNLTLGEDVYACTRNVTMSPAFFRHKEPFNSGPYSKTTPRTLLTDKYAANACSTNSECTFYINHTSGPENGFCSPSIKAGAAIDDANVNLCYKLLNEPKIEYILPPTGLGASICTDHANCTVAHSYCRVSKVYNLSLHMFCVLDKCIFGKIISQETSGYVWKKSGINKKLYCPIPYPSAIRKEDADIISATVDNESRLVAEKFLSISFPFDPSTKEQWNFDDGYKITYCTKNSDCSSLDDDKYQGYCQYAADPTKLGTVTADKTLQKQDEVLYCYKMRRAEFQYVRFPDEIGLIPCKDRSVCDGQTENKFLLWDCQKPIEPNMTSSFCTMKLQTTGFLPSVDTQSLEASDADKVLLPYEMDSPPRLIPKDRVLERADTCTRNSQCNHLNILGTYGYCYASKHSGVYKNSDGRAGAGAHFCYALIPFNNEQYEIEYAKDGPKDCAATCTTGYSCRDMKLKYVKTTGIRLCTIDIYLVPYFFTEKKTPFSSGPYANNMFNVLLERNEIFDNGCSKNKQCSILGSTNSFCSETIYHYGETEMDAPVNLCYKLDEEPNFEYLLPPDQLGPIRCDDNSDCRRKEYRPTSDVPFCGSTKYGKKKFCVRGRPRTALYTDVSKMDATTEAISSIIFPYDKYYLQPLPIAPNDSYTCSKNEDCFLLANDTTQFTGYCYPSIDQSKTPQAPNDAFKLCYRLANGDKEFDMKLDDVGPIKCTNDDDCEGDNKCAAVENVNLCVKGGDYCSDEKWPAAVGTVINEKGYQYKTTSVKGGQKNVYCGVPYSSEFGYPEITTMGGQLDVRINEYRNGSFGEVAYPYETLFKTRWSFKTKYWQFRTCTKNSECSFLDNDEYIGYCKQSWKPTFTTIHDMELSDDAFCYKMKNTIDQYIFYKDRQGLIACTDNANCTAHIEDINNEWKCREVSISNDKVAFTRKFCTNSALRPALFHGVTFYNITSKMMQDSLQALVANRKDEFVPEYPTLDMECKTNEDCDIHTTKNYTAYCYNTTHHSASNDSFSAKKDQKFCFRLANVPYTYYDVYPKDVGPTQCKKNQECHSLGKYGENDSYWYCKTLTHYEEPRMRDVKICARSKLCPDISFPLPKKHSCKIKEKCHSNSGKLGMCYAAVEEDQHNMCCEYNMKKCSNGGYPSLPILTCQTHDDCPADDSITDDDHNRTEYTLLNITKFGQERPIRRWCDTAQNLCCDGSRTGNSFEETYCDDGATVIRQQPFCTYYKPWNKRSGECLQDPYNHTKVLGGNCTFGHCCPSIHVPVQISEFLPEPPPPDIAGYAGLTNTSCIMVRHENRSHLNYYRVPYRYKFAYCHEESRKVVLIGRGDISGYLMGRTTQHCTSASDCLDRMCVREYTAQSVCYKKIGPKFPLRFYMILHFILVYWAWQFYWQYQDYVPIAVLNEWCYRNRFIPDLEKVAEEFEDITWFEEEIDVLGYHAHSMSFENELYQFYRRRPYNASFVHMPFGPHYICCAAPLSEEQLEDGLDRGHTTEEFINLIVSTNTEVIVMFGDWYEFGQTRSAEYLPLPEEDVVKFKIFKAETDAEYKSYPFCYPWAIAAITDPQGDPDGHEFWHFTYPGWGEEETPRDVEKLLGIRELIEAPEFENTQILLHCRRGILQSASFLAMLYFAQRCTINPRLDMISLLREFRYQRPGTITNSYDWFYLYHGACSMMVEMGAIQQEGMLDVPFHVWQRNQISYYSDDDIDRHQRWQMCDFSASLLEFENEQYEELGDIGDFRLKCDYTFGWE